MEKFSRYQSPNPVCLSGNPIKFQIEYTGGVYPIFDFTGIRVTFSTDGTIYTFEDNKPWNGDNLIEFEVHEFFNKLIKRSVNYDLSKSNYVVHRDGCVIFNVKYGYRKISDGSWVWEDDTTPQNQLLDNNSYCVINGSFPELFLDVMNQRHTDFYMQFILPDEKKFLTWQKCYPGYKTLSPNQPERLFFFIHDDSLTGLKMVYEMVYTDGSTETATRTISFENNRIVEFGTGLIDFVHERMNQSKEVMHYLFYLNATTSGKSEWFRYSEIIEYKVDNRNHRNNTLFFYANNLGGFDVLWCTGRIKRIGKFESTKKFKDNRYYNGGQTSSTVKKNSQWEVFVGRKSREEIKLVEQILFNFLVFMPVNGLLIPVDAEDMDCVFEDSAPGFIEVKLTFTLAYKETAYGDTNRLNLYSWGEFFNKEFSSDEFLVNKSL